MPMRNRRVRLLILAVLLTIIFFAYSRSDPQTIDQAKQYAKSKYNQAYQAYDKTIGKQKGSSGTGGSEPVGLEAKKDEPFRVDFGAYSKAAQDAEATGPSLPPPAAAVPPPPPLYNGLGGETTTKAAAVPVETKVDDPMRVDFDKYNKAAAVPIDETTGKPDPMKMDVISNPNPIAAVVEAKQDSTTSGKKDDKKTDDKKTDEKKTDDKKVDDKKSKEKAKTNGLVDETIPQVIGEGRVEIDVTAVDNSPPVHWSKFPEKFPASSTRMYPFNAATLIPKIQFAFKKTASNSGEDAEKLAAIKAATKHSWSGYAAKAMGHDEVKPVSGEFANPFNAWGATLIDSLDTLWLMGMREEFEQALKYVEKIDFTTSKRPDIPVFETTIRYLGGLLGAYEISGQNYKILLQKAAQLGDILYAAFDTPNRMPMTYYQWKPAFASQAHRASSQAILAEIGSLSLELTRLGQLVGDAKYYDAIARITDALDEYQDKTHLPGLWPAKIDASGCKRTNKQTDGSYEELEKEKPKLKTETKPDPKLVPEGLSGAKSAPGADAAGKKNTIDNSLGAGPDILGKSTNELLAKPPGTMGDPVAKPPTKDTVPPPPGAGVAGIGKIEGFGNPYPEGSLDTPGAKNDLINKAAGQAAGLMRRALDAVGAGELLDARAADAAAPKAKSNAVGSEKEKSKSASQAIITNDDVCIPQGLSTHEYSSDTFTLGAAADSTYEYLPKMHLLLGGRVEQYRKMYVKSADAALKWLIFRPMIPDEKRELLFAGNVDTKVKSGSPDQVTRDFSAVGSHLTCFVGGMFGMAGKIFDRPQDIETARKLTETCIWAYNVTHSGIMPEVFGMIKCESKESCKWDQKKYYEELDPFRDARLNDVSIMPGGASKVDKDVGAAAAAQVVAPPVGLAGGKSGLQKRQYGGGEMQYGVQTAPAVAPADKVHVVAEVPPLNMAAAGLSGVNAPAPDELAIKMPYDAGAGKKLPEAYDVPASSVDKKVPNVLDPAFGGSDSSKPADSKAPGAAVLPGGAAPGGDGAKLVSPPVKPGTTTGDGFKPKPLSHEEFVKNKIEDERLPTGMTGMWEKKYKLRPEAIESVFYMYRITGEQYWRDRGWEMWNAVYTKTYAQFGATAIDDVSKTTPEPIDQEESFWLAETLKYFYLLYDDPERYSLDEWVLNTEAHFFSTFAS